MTERASAAPTERARAHPPETTEGWYAFHQVLAVDRAPLRAMSADARTILRAEAQQALDSATTPSGDGWSALVPLVGSRGDVMLVHFRPTLDAIGEVQQSLA